MIMEENKEYDLNDVISSLNDLNSNTVATNQSIKELTEFLYQKEQAADKEKAALKKAAEDEENARLEADADQASAAADQEQQEAEYKEEVLSTLHSIDDGVQFNNQLFATQTLYLGIIFGILFIKIFFDSLRSK